jgi:hypothetical protein
MSTHAGLMDAEVDSLEQRVDRAYNPHWGSCLREGNENSRIGRQVNDYAEPEHVARVQLRPILAAALLPCAAPTDAARDLTST